MMVRLIVLLGLVLAVPVLWVAQCSGPEPSVTGLHLSEPSDEKEPYRLEAIIRNDGRGHGQVEVTFRLVDRSSGQTFEDEKKAQLEPKETTRVVAEIQAPPGNYEPMVEALYPPR